MLRKVYINNFRCLVGFEVSFNEFAVLCGPNGSGKSSVFDALKLVRDLATGEAVLGGEGVRDVSKLELTNWSNENILTINLEFEINDDIFKYFLEIQQVSVDVKPRIISERATRNQSVLFNRDLDGVKFTTSRGEQKGFPLDWRQAALGAIEARGATSDLKMLQEAFDRLIIVRPNPRDMEADSRIEVRRPDLYLNHLTSWYRHLFQEQEWSDSLRDSLRSVWPDFMSFRLESIGRDSKALQLRFGSERSEESSLLYFDQLSDGEKGLVALYMIRAALDTGSVATVLIDEPDNYIGLPELQPWTFAMMEVLDRQRQAILISHHPEILTYGRGGSGHYLWRDNHTTPTRVANLEFPEGIPVSEAIARGWVNV